MNPNIWSLTKQAASAGILQGGRPYARNFLYVGQNIPVFAGASRYETIADALAAMQSGDVLLLGDQTYNEGNLTIDTDNITIIGCSTYGKTSIAPSTAAYNGILIKSNFVCLVNLDVAAGSAGTYAVKAGYETTLSLNGFRAYNCKFEGGTYGLHIHGMGDVLIEDCEFAWTANGIVFQSNSHGFCTEIFIRRCTFHNYTTAALAQFANAEQVDILSVQDCRFLRQEGGTAPTKFIDMGNNGNIGTISGCFFSNTTNQAAKIAIGSGILFVTNATEAGWSTARPA